MFRDRQLTKDEIMRFLSFVVTDAEEPMRERLNAAEKMLKYMPSQANRDEVYDPKEVILRSLIVERVADINNSTTVDVLEKCGIEINDENRMFAASILTENGFEAVKGDDGQWVFKRIK